MKSLGLNIFLQRMINRVLKGKGKLKIDVLVVIK